MFKNALVSVSDKTGLVELLKPLVEKGLRVVSTGGTAEHLRGHDIPVIDVSEQTGFPEMMEGRVKTLHPSIHMPLLARDGNIGDQEALRASNLQPFDLVVVNLYPFEKALRIGASDQEKISFIDIGGPCLLRAAAKNYARITVLSDPESYGLCASSARDLSLRRELAARAFAHVASYDAMIARFLHPNTLDNPYFALGGAKVKSLRYGENPMQKASWYRVRGEALGLHDAEILQGKELSYNNVLDLDAALNTLREFAEPCSVAVKHNNPCGVGVADHVRDAVHKCLEADPVSVFGGIVAVNRPLDSVAADQLTQNFLECILAPQYDEGALKILATKKNLRVLKFSSLINQAKSRPVLELVRSIEGGFLVQSSDEIESEPMTNWKYYGEQPNPQTLADLLMAWKVCAHAKSNAIVLVSQGQTVGIGMGQVNRVDAVEHAIQRLNKFHSGKTEVVLASDAFFPFSDSIELAARSGIRWVIQPGGSIKDEEVIHRAQALKINMIFTHRRHFSH